MNREIAHLREKENSLINIPHQCTSLDICRCRLLAREPAALAMTHSSHHATRTNDQHRSPLTSIMAREIMYSCSCFVFDALVDSFSLYCELAPRNQYVVLRCRCNSLWCHKFNA